MKKYFIFVFYCFLLLSEFSFSQEIEHNFNDFYTQSLRHDQESFPLDYVRESDVLWKKLIWRNIDLREKFNQYMYYPTEMRGIHGRKCLSCLLWQAVVSGDIPIYEDDEFKIPIDNSDFVYRYTKADTVVLEVVDDDENYEYQTVLIPKEFLPEEILHFNLKEVWYIDKQQTDQKVVILGISPVKEMFKEIAGELEYMGSINLFWIPLRSYNVRQLFAKNEAYYEDNIAHLPSWENIFITRMFSAYITRESNRFNRSISDYLTGSDAIWESERIELDLLNISLDMWEY